MLLLCSAGCVRRDGRNSDCKWPPETAVHAATPRHLSADAEYAEDLAIRYADAHHGLRTRNYLSGELYAAERNRCMAELFGQVAKEHNVSLADVSSELGRNRALIDLAENLPFALLYCFAAAAVCRMIWRRYPPHAHGWIPGVIMSLFLSLVFATGGVMLGEEWCWLAETERIGNGHMSYRVARLPWALHRPELFAAALIVFWVATAEAARQARPRAMNVA